MSSAQKLICSSIATQTIQVHTIEKCPTVVFETDVTISECLSKIVPVELSCHICVRNLLKLVNIYIAKIKQELLKNSTIHPCLINNKIIYN